MKRIWMMVLRNIIFVPFLWIKLLWYVHHMDRYSEEQKYRLLQTIARRAVKSGNVDLQIFGTENIPEQNGFMIAPNHQGMFDVVALYYAVQRPFGVVSKKELENVPFLKQVFALTHSFMIDREDLRQSMTVIQEVSRALKEGRNYLIFPEGTRSKNGNRMHEFKGGSFKAAQKARCPVLPVALIDSYKPFDTNTIQQVTVQVHFLAPIPYEEYQSMKTTELAMEVQERIRKVIEEQ